MGPADEPGGGWEIMYDVEASALTVYRTNGVVADSEGPTLYNREEFERFVSNLRYAASQVWPS
jgi:hypothetical protein